MARDDAKSRAGKSARTDKALGHRLKRLRSEALPANGYEEHSTEQPKKSVALELGWGRLIFAQTYESNADIAAALAEEGPARRDIAFYIRDPHVLLALAPQTLFLDPSHTYRLDLPTYRASRRRSSHGFFIRRVTAQADAEGVNAIYAMRNMVTVRPDFFWSRRDSRSITYFVAEDEVSGDIIGTVTGIDHSRAFGDPEKGSSLWCLAVDPRARHPGIGEVLVRRLAEHFKARGAAFMDLSVMHDNEQAIALYEKLGFHRVPIFAVKRKNPINEKLFTQPPEDYDALNPYARIIIDEAHRRGVSVDITDAEGGFFQLTFGGRSIQCRESLSEMTSAVAMSICDDKAVTRRVVKRAGLEVPEQIDAGDREALKAFLEKHGKVVVKPARGEQGRGVSVGLETLDETMKAVEAAREACDRVLVEACFEGEDLRLIVIDYRLVAAAVRRPPRIRGDGHSTVEALITHLSRRRSAATGGESTIPIDDETKRTLAAQGHTLDSVPGEGEEIVVRKTANLHTGGSIHDVTEIVHPELVRAACAAARAIDIPVVGIDLMVVSPDAPDYIFVEANERPGLANHEPQPTAERFVDLLFPRSGPRTVEFALSRKGAGKDEETE